MRIPKKLTLPWNWEITIKQVSDGFMADTLGADNADGLWDIDTMTIYLKKSLPINEKVEILGHEADHVLNDWRRMTAQKAAIFYKSQRDRKRLQARSKRR